MATQKAHVSEEKKRNIAELAKLAKEKGTVLLVSIKGIPAAQYQETMKKFRGKAVIKVPKKSMISRALDSSDNEGLKKLKDYIKDSTAILFSDSDAFDVSAELLSKKIPVAAKVGQKAPKDIVVQPGPTELLPGPAISELGAVGIPVQVEKGKITIKEEKTIVKEGEKISSAAADVMNKLDIKPFSIGFTPIAAFDSKTGKIYTEIEIDKEGTLGKLEGAFGRALPFAVCVGYSTSETINFILAKAAIHGKALGKFEGSPEEKKGGTAGEEKRPRGDEEEKEEVKRGEKKKDESQTKSEEEK